MYLPSRPLFCGILHPVEISRTSYRLQERRWCVPRSGWPKGSRLLVEPASDDARNAGGLPVQLRYANLCFGILIESPAALLGGVRVFSLHSASFSAKPHPYGVQGQSSIQRRFGTPTRWAFDRRELLQIAQLNPAMQSPHFKRYASIFEKLTDPGMGHPKPDGCLACCDIAWLAFHATSLPPTWARVNFS